MWQARISTYLKHVPSFGECGSIICLKIAPTFDEPFFITHLEHALSLQDPVDRIPSFGEPEP